MCLDRALRSVLLWVMIVCLYYIYFLSLKLFLNKIINRKQVSKKILGVKKHLEFLLRTISQNTKKTVYKKHKIKNIDSLYNAPSTNTSVCRV